MIPFEELLRKHRGPDFKAPERLLCLDPGETTGYALFENGKPTVVEQARTVDNWLVIGRLFANIGPTMVIYENYRVYEHKLQRHANSEVFTLRLVGVIEYLCDVIHVIPRYNQMAHQAKGFVTDDKLKAWNFYQPAKRHGRDAIRHGCYFLLFDKSLGTKK